MFQGWTQHGQGENIEADEGDPTNENKTAQGSAHEKTGARLAKRAMANPFSRIMAPSQRLPWQMHFPGHDSGYLFGQTEKAFWRVASRHTH